MTTQLNGHQRSPSGASDDERVSGESSFWVTVASLPRPIKPSFALRASSLPHATTRQGTLYDKIGALDSQVRRSHDTSPGVLHRARGIRVRRRRNGQVQPNSVRNIYMGQEVNAGRRCSLVLSHDVGHERDDLIVDAEIAVGRLGPAGL